jgi:hypothetical protein
VRIVPGNFHLEWLHDVEVEDPTESQILAYDEAAGLWKNIDIPESAAIISDTAPVDPVLGTQWFNSSTGKSYLYYSDAWVEVDSASPPQIGSFADATVRAAAIPSPSEGVYTHLNDTDRLEFWNGSAWTTPFGFTLLSDSSFTAATTFTLSNIFNANYTSYRLYINLTAGTANQDISLQLTASGTASTANYINVETSLSANTTATSWPLTQTGQNGKTGVAVELFNPFLAVRTYGTSDWFYDDGTTLIYKKRGLAHRVNTSYDGIRLTVAAGITGSVRVFGIKE